MKFKELIQKFNTDGTKCFVNGLGQGKIIAIDDDYLTFEIVNKAEKQENTTKEQIFIPMSEVFSLSEGALKISTLNTLPKEEETKKDEKV